jgi:pimeloyl-ACP methyl ester carboxylesterase
MRDNRGSNTMRDVSFSRRQILGAAAGVAAIGALAEPFKATAAEPGTASGVAGSDQPASWVDPAMPEVRHRMIEANGLRLHVAEQGEGPLVILCHGFPECWYSWRHQLGALAKAGFHAVAPDLRGYGRSDRPEEDEKYTILHDIGDVVGLLDALGEQQAVIAGHDIGAAIAWQAALLRPDRFRGVIAMSPPFRPRGFGSSTVPPTTLMPHNENAVFYQLFLMSRQAEAALGGDLRRTFRAQFYSLSGDRSPSAGGGFPGGMVPRKGGLLAEPASLPAWITEADVDVYVAEFTRSGLRGALAWWRNIDRGWELMAPLDGAKVTVPALYIAGDRDMIVSAFREDIARQSIFVPKLRPVMMLPGCGHWTQQERASEVSAAMIDFMRQL